MGLGSLKRHQSVGRPHNRAIFEMRLVGFNRMSPLLSSGPRAGMWVDR